MSPRSAARCVCKVREELRRRRPQGARPTRTRGGALGSVRASPPPLLSSSALPTPCRALDGRRRGCARGCGRAHRRARAAQPRAPRRAGGDQGQKRRRGRGSGSGGSCCQHRCARLSLPLLSCCAAAEERSGPRARPPVLTLVCATCCVPRRARRGRLLWRRCACKARGAPVGDHRPRRPARSPRVSFALRALGRCTRALRSDAGGGRWRRPHGAPIPAAPSREGCKRYARVAPHATPSYQHCARA